MRYLKVGLSALFFLTLVFLFLALPGIITITKIICFSQYGRCDDALTVNLETILGKNLKEAKANLEAKLAQDLLIRDFSVQYQIPENLQIYIILKKPKFALWSQEEGKAVLLDEKGTVLTAVESTNLPKVVTVDKLLRRGEAVDKEKLFALEIVSALSYLFEVKEGVLLDSRLEANLPEGKKVIFPLEGDKQVLLGSLKLILSGLNGEVKDSKIGNVSQIDLRFKNPVLK